MENANMMRCALAIDAFLEDARKRGREPDSVGCEESPLRVGKEKRGEEQRSGEVSNLHSTKLATSCGSV